MSERLKGKCPLCKSRDGVLFFEAANIPAQDGVVWPTLQQAKEAPKGKIELVFCKVCNCIYNQAYEHQKITFLDYDFSLHYSALYQSFNDQLTSYLIDQHFLHQKTILEIGCGRGHFLIDLCKKGNCSGIGIDPSYGDAQKLPYDTDQVRFIKDFYQAGILPEKVDYIICRHVIDELEDPIKFISLFHDNLKDAPDVGIYLEVPNVIKTFEKKLIWNLGYAKRWWFTPKSLQYLLNASNFKVLQFQTLLQEDYLGIEAAPAAYDPASNVPSANKLMNTLFDFSASYQSEKKRWSSLLEHWKKQGFKIALWGAGMRGINFLSTFSFHDLITKVVDINPHRQGKYLPVSGYQVHAPESIQEEWPDILIISNASYEKEIKTQAMELGYRGEFEVF